MACAKQAK